MAELERLINEWSTALVSDHPELEPLQDQLVDHVYCVAKDHIAGGIPEAEAVGLATAELGPADEIVSQFQAASRQSILRRAFVCKDRDERAELAVAAAWIIMSLGWAGAMIAFENTFNWMMLGWTLTTFGPLTVIGTWLSRRGGASPPSSDIAD